MWKRFGKAPALVAGGLLAGAVLAGTISATAAAVRQVASVPATIDFIPRSTISARRST